MRYLLLKGNKMKKILIATAIISWLGTSSAFAADNYLRPYIEGQFGYLNTNSVDTKTVNENIDNLSVSGKLKFDYDSDIAWGGEIGLADIGIQNVRVGISYTHSKIDLKKISIPGTITINDNAGTPLATVVGSVNLDRNTIGVAGTYTYLDSLGVTQSASGAASVTNADLDPSLVDEKNKLLDDFRQHLNLYMVNAYYDFNNTTEFTPFLGVGIGVANLKNTKDNEFAFSLSGGAKYNIDKNIYIGAKGTFTRVNGPTSNKYGVDVGLDNIDIWKADVLLGYQF